MAGLCEGGNEPSASLKAISTGVAQSVKALACWSELRSGAGSISAWADYLVGFFPRFSPTVSTYTIVIIVTITTIIHLQANPLAHYVVIRVKILSEDIHKYISHKSSAWRKDATSDIEE
ncbi:hypothetical protein ANN_16168 [Periplaneta americana]|uniref:Uncharacterized protein n=1 Tax=Periplaneta americana TaxID=6978 RepID=A0ABQ8SIA9_PERAM|nr:hypothetical protein ANN_16168 [Periplaneta americana]